jgi:restriction endonuclease S subunit
LDNIAFLLSGIYAKPDIIADTYYLQPNHFAENGVLVRSTKPQLKMSSKYEKHLLRNNDILFAAKGFNNFSVVFHESTGKAVASSSFIIIRVNNDFQNKVLPDFLCWFLNNSSMIEVFHKQKATTTVPSISIAQLCELELTIPDLKTQELIVFVQQCRDREQELLQQLEKLQHKQLQTILFNAIKRSGNEN